MLEFSPPVTEATVGKAILAGDARSDDILRRPDEAGFFVPLPAYDQYMRMHKRFVGPATAGKLLSIHDQLAAAPWVNHRATAGWAAAEAALVAVDSPIEGRLYYLQLAQDSWDAAIALQQERNALRGLPEDYPDANINRLLLSRIFTPIMEGMVGGDVTKRIRQKVYDDLLLLAAQNACGLIEAIDSGHEPGPHIGLAHEINAMLAVNRLKSPTLIAMPAIARADSGEFYPEQTHDIDLLHLYKGKILSVTTMESKSRPRPKHYARYEAAIVGGHIHLFTKTGTSPVNTVELFLKEHDDMLTGDEQIEIEGMTDTIVHLARHRFSKIPGIPAHCRDVERCEVVPRHRSGRIARGIGELAAVLSPGRVSQLVES